MYTIEDAGVTIRLYRLVERLPPDSDPRAAADEFRSMAALGKIARGRPVYQRWSTGVSLFATSALARAKAAEFPSRRWRFIVGVAIPTDGRLFTVERTSISMGHFTVWGDPDAFAERIVQKESL